MANSHKIEHFLTQQEAAKALDVPYFTLRGWIKRDVGKVITKGLAYHRNGWLLHKEGVEILRKLIKEGTISSEKGFSE